MRNVTHTLINLIKENTDISVAASRYFMKFISKCLTSSSIIFDKFLTLVINTLVPIGKLNTTLSEECLKILNYLIVDNSDVLYNTIGKLDPFPNHENFRHINDVWSKIKYGNDRFNLQQEITHFLNAGELMESHFRYEGLKKLKILLSENKSELVELYVKLQDSRGFSNDCVKSILHQLIYMLVKLTNSDDKSISTEAARCLGELGPADLTTMVLRPEKNVNEHLKKPLELISRKVIILLSKYIVDRDVKVTNASIKALKAVLSSKEGRAVVKNHEQCCDLDLDNIAPFLSIRSSKDSIHLLVNEKEFMCFVDRNEVWCPTFQCTHEKWITGLVSNLLKTFPSNSFIAELIAVCKLKV